MSTLDSLLSSTKYSPTVMTPMTTAGTQNSMAESSGLNITESGGTTLRMYWCSATPRA